MSPPSGSLDLINLALLQLHAAPLADLTSTDDHSAVAALRQYDQTRRRLIRNHTWNFARYRASISLRTDDTPLFDYLGYYDLPVYCLKLHHVGTEYDQWWGQHEYDIQGKTVLYSYSPSSTETPPDSIYIEYTRDVTDVNLMDALFIDLLVAELAVDLCMPVTGDVKLKGYLGAEAVQKRREAVALNHQERMMRIVERDPVAEARGSDSDSIWDGQLRVPPSAWPS